MLTLPADKDSSRHLLVRGLRYGCDSAIAKKKLLLMAEELDPAVEEQRAGYDSPWRSLALLFRICDRPDLADAAFRRAEQWFDHVLTAETKNSVLKAARLTMQALSRSQAGKAGGVSSASLRLVKSSLQSFKIVDPESWSRHISLNFRRISFLAHYFQVDNIEEFELSELGLVETVPARNTAQELGGKMLDLWGNCRLAVEVADRKILLDKLQRILTVGGAIALACNSGELQPCTQAEVVSLLKGYFGAIDFCEPTVDEAVIALDTVSPVIQVFRLNGIQAIEERAGLFLARSIFAPTVAMPDLPEMVESIAQSIAKCVDSAKRVGFRTDVISRRVKHTFLQFTSGDVRNYCAALSSPHDRIETLKHMCSAARSLNVDLDSETVKDITALCVAGKDLPTDLLGLDAATRFGVALCTPALVFANDAPQNVSNALQEAITSECKRFFHAAALEALSTVADPIESTRLLHESVQVFTAAEIRSPSTVWQAALFCLNEAPLSAFDTIVGHWILADADLEQALWTKGWRWSKLDDVLTLLLNKCGSDAAPIAKILRRFADRNAAATLEYLFGESRDVQKTMEPVVSAVLRSENPAAWPLVRAWIANSSFFPNREALLRDSVAALLEVFLEESEEGHTLVSAARALIALRQATLQTKSQPHLAPVAAYLNEVQLAAKGRLELVRMLALKADDDNPQVILETAQLSAFDATQLLDLLCRNSIVYTFSELLAARKMAKAILERTSVRWQSTIADLFIRYAQPEVPDRWTSRFGSSDGEHLQHSEVFERVRSIADALASSDFVSASQVTANLLLLAPTNVWEVAWLLADLKPLAHRTKDIFHAYREACHSCLNAILTSESAEVTYESNQTKTRIAWRVRRRTPAIVEEVICANILEHADEVIAILPRTFDQPDEFLVIIRAGLSVLQPAAQGSLCATLTERVPDLTYWSDGRDVGLEVIRHLLTLEKTAESAASAVESTLRARRSKKPWTEDNDLVARLCGLPAPIGDRFAKLLFEQVSPREMATAQTRRQLLASLAGQMNCAIDLSNRLGPVLTEARSAASKGAAGGLGVWATLVSTICERLWGWRRSFQDRDVAEVLSFLNLSAFGEAVIRWPVVRQPRNSESGNTGFVSDAIGAWHSAVLRGLRTAPGLVLKHAEVATLLKLHEQGMEFEEVSELLEALRAEAPRHHSVLLACLEVTLAHQDLDGIVRLLDAAMPAEPETRDVIAETFVVEAMRCFARAAEFDLAAVCFSAVSESMRKRAGEGPVKRLDVALAFAGKTLKQEFPGAPTLVLRRTGKYESV